MKQHPALVVKCATEMIDPVVGLLWQSGTIGIEEVGKDTLRAFFESPPGKSVIDAITKLGVESVSVEELPDKDWVMISRLAQGPRRVGRLLIRPPWSRSRPRRDELLIVIDPARAFGTGGHESTRLILTEILADPPVGKSVVDVGCGSGILALVALLLGATSALAVDNDVECTDASLRNARMNRLEERLTLQLGDISTVSGGHDLVLANLTEPLLTANAEQLVGLVATGGTLLASGFLGRDSEGLARLFDSTGDGVVNLVSDGEWCLLRFARPDATP